MKNYLLRLGFIPTLIEMVMTHEVNFYQLVFARQHPIKDIGML